MHLSYKNCQVHTSKTFFPIPSVLDTFFDPKAAPDSEAK